MESITGFLVLAALVARYLGRDRATAILFTLALAMTVVVLSLHAVDPLKLCF